MDIFQLLIWPFTFQESEFFKEILIQNRIQIFMANNQPLINSNFKNLAKWGVPQNGRLCTTADNGQRPIMYNGLVQRPILYNGRLRTTALMYNGPNVQRTCCITALNFEN